jgi:hypothetical protein
MSTPTKAYLSPNPMILASLAAGANLLGSVLDFSTKFCGAIMWDWAPIATTASPAATMLQLLAAAKSGADTEDDSWSVVQEWLSPTAVPTLYSANVTGTAAASTITVSAGTLTLFQDHFLKGATTDEAGSEWIYPIAQSGTTVTLRAALKNSYAAKDMYSAALRLRFEQDFSNLLKYKVCIFNNRGATNRTTANRVRIVTLDAVE